MFLGSFSMLQVCPSIPLPIPACKMEGLWKMISYVGQWWCATCMKKPKILSPFKWRVGNTNSYLSSMTNLFSIKMIAIWLTGLQTPVKPHHFQRVMGNQLWCLIFWLLSLAWWGAWWGFRICFNSLEAYFILTMACCREARVIFKPGINCDSYFTSENLLQQVECAIDIFEGKTKGNSRVFHSLTMPTRKELLIMPYKQERYIFDPDSICYVTVGMFARRGLGSTKQRHWVVWFWVLSTKSEGDLDSFWWRVVNLQRNKSYSEE